MTRIKTCGLSTPETITASIDAGTDFIGFVFYPPSPRHLEIEVAKYLATQIPDHIEIVGLFVNPDDQTLQNVIHDVPLTMIQLHGAESVERVAGISTKFKLPIIKAIAIENQQDLDKAAPYDAVADWLLFDAKGEALPGGNGIAFDWHLLQNYQGTKPWMLAGGLTPDNVAQALETTSPNAVDISSGVESDAGIKDTVKIQAFISAVKKA